MSAVTRSRRVLNTKLGIWDSVLRALGSHGKIGRSRGGTGSALDAEGLCGEGLEAVR